MPRPRKPKPVVLNDLHLHDLVTECPSGWSTVANWWATEERRYLPLLADPLATLREEEERLETAYLKTFGQDMLLGACSLYRRMGIELERAYPTVFLARHYPAAP